MLITILNFNSFAMLFYAKFAICYSFPDHRPDHLQPLSSTESLDKCDTMVLQTI